MTFLISLPFCGKSGKWREFSRTEFLLGTYVTLRVYYNGEVEPIFKKAFSEIRRISQKYSFEEENSYLNKLNRGEITLDEETEFLLKFAKELHKGSKGAFDPTIGELKLLWGFNKKPRLPFPVEIKEALKYVGYGKLVFKEGFKKDPKILLDFSSFAKGYAVDRATEILRKAGINSALVDAGGDIRLLGEKPDGCPWRIGIKNPRGEGIIRVLELRNTAIATSGDYENFFIKDGIRYCHLLDPETGYPPRSLRSASVIAPTAIEADGYATALFIMGRKDGFKLVRKEGLRGIVVDREGRLWDTKEGK